MPRTILVRNADVLVTIEDARREIRGGGVLVEGNWIMVVGPSGELPGTGFQAGGPSCLLRFCTEQAVTVNTAAVAGNLALLGKLQDRGEGTPVRHYSGGR